MEDKLKAIDDYINKLKRVREKALDAGEINEVMQTIAAEANIRYITNQDLYADSLEKVCGALAQNYYADHSNYIPNNNTVLFYDGFGMDLRGWAASFARALAHLDGKSIVYVTKLESKDKIPHILMELQQTGASLEFIDTTSSYESWAKQLNDIFVRYHPANAFFYTTPYDVSGAVVFSAYKGLVKRMQIDLTDHAFWLGVKSVDIVLESRMLGASNAIFKRNISPSAIKKLDCCLYINNDEDSDALPFDTNENPYFFSGGSLYKTLGDEEAYYYKMVSRILDREDSVKFLYAGSGDCRKINELIQKYPARVFRVDERKDFYRLIKDSRFMLNTYPMFGGLMMRYAAHAGVVPLTLIHDSDQNGILLNQEKLGIQFDTIEEIVEEAHRLIIDNEYRAYKGEQLRNAVTSEESFKNCLSKLINEGETGYQFDEIEQIDTEQFQREYIQRLEVEKAIEDAIAQRMNKKLAMAFPRIFIRKFIRRFIYD